VKINKQLTIFTFQMVR